MAEESMSTDPFIPLSEAKRDLAQSRIIHAARVALAQRGLATTVDEVAEAAGVSRRTVFRHFATRERLLAAAIRDGLRSYSQQLPELDGTAVDDWLLDLLAAAERREARRRFAQRVTAGMWQARGGAGRPPVWLVDAVAVHMSGFTTQS